VADNPWQVFSERWNREETGGETECGYGSMWVNAKGCAEWLVKTLSRLEIKTLNDAGCGDLNWISRIDLGEVDYLGYDLVQPPKPLAPFQILNIAREVMRPADAILCRDVLFHFPNDEVAKTLELFRKSSKLLISTCTIGASPDRHTWSPRLLDNFSPIDLRLFLGEPLDFIEEPRFGRIVGIWSI
jgi:hypothetical protein